MVGIVPSAVDWSRPGQRWDFSRENLLKEDFLPLEYAGVFSWTKRCGLAYRSEGGRTPLNSARQVRSSIPSWLTM